MIFPGAGRLRAVRSVWFRVSGVRALRPLPPPKLRSISMETGKPMSASFVRTLAEWLISRSSTGLVCATQFGSITDRIVPGDYIGDGKADIAVWRPASGEWFVLRSEDFSFFAFPFGSNGDLPVHVQRTFLSSRFHSEQMETFRRRAITTETAGTTRQSFDHPPQHGSRIERLQGR